MPPPPSRPLSSELEPPQETSRIAGVNTGLCDILGDHCAGANHGLIANGDREDTRVSPDADTVAELGRAPETAVCRRTSLNKEIVDEHCPVRDEAVVPNRNQLTKKC